MENYVLQWWRVCVRQTKNLPFFLLSIHKLTFRPQQGKRLVVKHVAVLQDSDEIPDRKGLQTTQVVDELFSLISAPVKVELLSLLVSPIQVCVEVTLH